MHRRVVFLAFLVATAAMLGGCSGQEAATLSSGVSVEIQQGRTDYASGTIVLRIVNDSGDDLGVRRVTLRSPAFPDADPWERGTTVRAGTTVDLRTSLPEANCAEPADAPQVSLEFRATNAEGTAHMTASDPLGTLDRLRDESCLAAEVERLATITIGTPQVTGAGADSVAQLPVTFTPTGTNGTLEVTGAAATPLLQPAAPLIGEQTDGWLLAVTLPGSGEPVTVHLDIVPARCDPHAIAEDKVGTVLLLTVNTVDLAGNYRLVPPTNVTDALLRFVHAACGMP